MWVAGRLRRTEEPQETTNAESGTVTIGGSAVGVLSRGEERSVPLASPGGYAWRPKNGERVLVIKGGTLGEERYVAGSLGDGEGRLYAVGGGASITLRRNGRVEIAGELYINGKAYEAPEEAIGGA